jgi:hypothetical protein
MPENKSEQEAHFMESSSPRESITAPESEPKPSTKLSEASLNAFPDQDLSEMVSKPSIASHSAVLLPIATVALYSYSFFFELGYATRFGYPQELIPISLRLILNIWVYLFIYLGFSVLFFQLNLQYWPHRGRAKYTLIAVFLIWLGLLIGVNAIAPRYLNWVLILSSVFCFLGGYFRRRATRTQTDGADQKIRQAVTQNEFDAIPMIYDARSKIPKDSIAYRLVSALGFDPLLIFLLAMIVIPGMFWLAGFSEAVSRKSFYTFSRLETEYIALRIFDEKIIAASFTRDGCSYSREFVVALIPEIRSLKPLDCSPRPLQFQKRLGGAPSPQR